VQVTNGGRRKKTVTLFVATTGQEAKIRKNPETGKFEHHGIKWQSFDNAIKSVHSYLAPAVKWAMDRVMHDDLDEFIEWKSKKIPNFKDLVEAAEKKVKKCTVHTWYQADMQLALDWGKLNDAIVSHTPVKKTNDNNYTSSVKLKISKSDFDWMMKDRFGTFIKVS